MANGAWVHRIECVNGFSKMQNAFVRLAMGMRIDWIGPANTLFV